MQNQNRKESAEAQTPKAPSEEDFVGLIKYVKEREEGLSRYSDKLRTSLDRIANVFGNAGYCQICGNAENQSKHVKYRDTQGYLHDEETVTINGIRVTYPANADYDHPFRPHICVTLNVEDETPYLTEEKDGARSECRLCIKNHELQIKETIDNGYGNDPDYATKKYWCFGQVPRSDLKALIKSGRLPKFLALVAQKLAEAEQEYGQVAETAEKMAKALE